MIKKAVVVFVAVSFFLGVITPQGVYAASASVFVSPSSSSVERDDTITVQVRVNSGSDAMDTAQARINFDSSRLAYVSHSGGDFTPFQQNVSGGSFEYVGLSPGGTSGNRQLFSITFRATNTGNANLGLSNVRVASGGVDLSVSSSGGSITVTSPSSSGGGSSGSSGGSSSGGSSGGGSSSPPSSPRQPSRDTTTATEPEEIEPPEFASKPRIDLGQGSITITVEADKPSELRMRYRIAGESTDWQTVHERDFQQEHEIIMGENTSLVPGTTYEIEIRLSDEDGNHSDIKKLEARTIGVTYRVKIADREGQPLSDYPVELRSDPMKAATDADGIVEFDDVTPGEHTLVFKIDGITIRQPVMVGANINLSEADADEIDTVSLPFSLANVESNERHIVRWDIAVYAGLFGAVGSFALQHSPLRRLGKSTLHAIRNKLRFSKKM